MRPDALWRDVQKLMICMKHCGIQTMSYNLLMMVEIIITNKTLEENNERKAERINGWAAMIGVVAAMVVTQPLVRLFLVCGERHVTHSNFHDKGLFLLPY